MRHQAEVRLHRSTSLHPRKLWKYPSDLFQRLHSQTGWCCHCCRLRLPSSCILLPESARFLRIQSRWIYCFPLHRNPILHFLPDPVLRSGKISELRQSLRTASARKKQAAVHQHQLDWYAPVFPGLQLLFLRMTRLPHLLPSHSPDRCQP